MLAAQHRPRCSAPNAFRFGEALCMIFVGPAKRRFSCVPSVQKLRLLPVFDRRISSRSKAHNYATYNARNETNRQHVIEEVDPHAGDIVLDNLADTLEAHRASNRASVIRDVFAKASYREQYKPDIAYRTPNAASKRRTEPRSSTQHGVDLLFDGDDPEDSIDWFNHLNIHRKAAVRGARRPLKSSDTDEPSLRVVTPSRDAPKRRRGKQRQHKEEADLSMKVKTLEYEGQYVAPAADSAAVAGEPLPWAVETPYIRSGLARLNAEIRAFEAYVRPTADELAARDAVVSEIRNLVQSVVPSCSLEVFGSQRTGLALATSDIDFRLYPPENHPLMAGTEKEKAPRAAVRSMLYRQLQALEKTCSESKLFKLTVIRSARYPLLSAQHNASGLDIQIVCSNDTEVSRSYMKGYLEQYPNLRAIYTVFRLMLEVRGLTDVYRGGLGSYSVFMMIVAGLRLSPGPATNDLAQQLLNVLAFYAELDTYRHGISIEPPKLFEKTVSESPKEKPKLRYKKKKQWSSKPSLETEPEEEVAVDLVVQGQQQMGVADPFQPYLLCLQDPADPFNDLGRKGYGIKHILETIKVLHNDLTARVEQDIPGSLLAELVGNSYELFEGRRQLLQEFGKEGWR